MAVEKIGNYNIHQNPATNENQFDVENYLNENWNKTKEVVNNNADELISVQGRASALETDNTTNKQDISEIKEEQTEQNTNIESLQTKLEKVEKEFNDYAIHGQASGEFIHLTDSAKASCKVDIKGNVKQDGEPTLDTPVEIQVVGNNINLLHMQEKSYIQLGVNVTQKESSLELNGTTNGAQNILSGGYVDIGNFKKGKYIFKAHISGSFEKQGSDDFALYIRKKNDTSKSYGNISGANIEEGTNSFIFELTEDTDLVIQIWVNASGIVFSNFEMKLKIEEGEIATSHSPYNLGSVKIIAINENLYNENNYADKLTIDTDETFKETSSTKIIKIPVKPNSIYTLSRSPVEGTTANIVYGISDTEPLANAKCTYNILHSTGTNKQIVTTANTKYICIRKQKNNSDYALFENMKVEENEVATSYIEHEENSVTVPIQQEMLLEDEFDRINKKEVHNWSKYEITGNEDWRKHATTSNNAFYFEAKNIFTNAETPANNKEEATIINTHYKNYAVDTIAQNNIEGTGLAMNTAYYIGTGLDGISTLEEFKAKMQELYNAGTPVTLYYKKTEATKLDLIQEQIEALEKLDEMQTYKNITNITTDSITILDVDYKKDLETWQKQQDDRITALEELLNTTQTSAMLIENLENDLLKEVE